MPHEMKILYRVYAASTVDSSLDREREDLLYKSHLLFNNDHNSSPSIQLLTVR